MLYAIVEKTTIEKCREMKMCTCMCTNNIVRWNKDNSKAIILVHDECKCCNINISMFTNSTILTIQKNDTDWVNQNIV